MALKKYAYYLKGNKIAIVQMDTTDISAEDYGKYKSPTENVTDGIEIEYTYAPWYRINDDDIRVTGTSYTEDGNGLLKIIGGSSMPTSEDYAYAPDKVTHVVIKDSDKFNGLHEISSYGDGSYLILKTKYNGGTVVENYKIFLDVSAMVDEEFEIDITRYQAQAITYYLKAKMSEEAMDIEGREYWMRLFSKQLEKGANSRKYGPRIIQGFGGLR